MSTIGFSRSPHAKISYSAGLRPATTARMVEAVEWAVERGLIPEVERADLVAELMNGNIVRPAWELYGIDYNVHGLPVSFDGDTIC